MHPSHFVASGKSYASITSVQGKGIMEAARGRAVRTRRKTYLSVLSLLVKWCAMSGRKGGRRKGGREGREGGGGEKEGGRKEGYVLMKWREGNWVHTPQSILPATQVDRRLLGFQKRMWCYLSKPVVPSSSSSLPWAPPLSICKHHPPHAPMERTRAGSGRFLFLFFFFGGLPILRSQTLLRLSSCMSLLLRTLLRKTSQESLWNHSPLQ